MSKNLLNKLQEKLDSGELLELVDTSFAVLQVQRALGFSDRGQYAKIVREFLISNDVDISHFTPNGVAPVKPIEKQCLCCGNTFTTEKRNIKEQVVCSRACSNTYFRSGENNGNFRDSPNNYRNKAFKHYSPVCIRCGFSNILALEVHHKDRDRSNNDLSNLETVCANCHTIEHKTHKA